MRKRDRERGSATIEAVIIVPAFMLFIALIIAAGRVQMARQSVDAAAAEAARAASISRTAAEAHTRAATSGNQPGRGLRLHRRDHRHQRIRGSSRHPRNRVGHRYLCRRTGRRRRPRPTRRDHDHINRPVPA